MHDSTSWSAVAEAYGSAGRAGRQASKDLMDVGLASEGAARHLNWVMRQLTRSIETLNASLHQAAARGDDS